MKVWNAVLFAHTMIVLAGAAFALVFKLTLVLLAACTGSPGLVQKAWRIRVIDSVHQAMER